MGKRVERYGRRIEDEVCCGVGDVGSRRQGISRKPEGSKREGKGGKRKRRRKEKRDREKEKGSSGRKISEMGCSPVGTRPNVRSAVIDPSMGWGWTTATEGPEPTGNLQASPERRRETADIRFPSIPCALAWREPAAAQQPRQAPASPGRGLRCQLLSVQFGGLSMDQPVPSTSTSHRPVPPAGKQCTRPSRREVNG